MRKCSFVKVFLSERLIEQWQEKAVLKLLACYKTKSVGNLI